MATITITEILGGDNIAASRIVLNNNFTLLQNAVNTLETRLNTSYVPGGSLNVGDVQILKYNRAVSTNLFLCQASAQIDGNLSLGTPTNASTLSLTGSISATAASTVNGGVTFDNTANAGADTFTNFLSTTVNDSESNLQWYAATVKSPVVLTQSLVSPYSLTITQNMNIVHLDVAAYTGSSPNNVNTFQLPNVTSVAQGQIITLVFDNNTSTAGTFALDNSVNFDPAFDNTALGANIILNTTITASNTDARFKGIWITLMAGINGWKVIGAHADVTYI